jgi:transposase
MLTDRGNLHLEIQTSRKNPVGILRTSFRDKATGRMLHTQHGRITGCSLEQLKMLQLAFRERVVPVDAPEAFRTTKNKEYGASRAMLELARELDLPRMLYSRPEPWVDCVMAMVAGRIVYQGSKLSLVNQWTNTTLWEQCAITGRPDVHKHCYEPLDRLLERQKAIQKKLAAKHLTNGCLVLYDITSSYFEGEYTDSEIVIFGYNRDGKKGHEQVVIGLLCNEEGCPIGCEVFAGNTSDAATVMGKISELRQDYGLEKLVFVGDRGMLTEARLKDIGGIEGVNTISALTHRQIFDLVARKVIQPELFDESQIVEIVDPDDPQKRYCLCRNPLTAESEKQTRQRLIKLTEEGLQKIAAYQRKTTVEVLGARVGKLLAKYKVGKLFSWHVEADPQAASSRGHKLIWNLDQDKVALEELLDGCYVVSADVEAGQMDKEQIVAAYKALGNVERAFRNLKTVQLEMRPFYHKKDERIRAHAFLCTLAYYVQWHMVERLRPLFEADGQGADRRWTVKNVIQRLAGIGRYLARVSGVEFYQNTDADEEQQAIIKLLGVTM